MTPPPPVPDPVPDWQAQLLQRITDLLREHDRLQQLGPDGFDGTDGSPETDWRAWLDTLNAAAEATEALAVSAGIDPADIGHARHAATEPARSAAEPGASAAEPATADTSPAGAGTQLYRDMLISESWRLERMAALHAARLDRVHAGVYSFGADPVTSAHLERAMTVAHARVAALADAAEITATDAEVLWHGPEVTRMRQATMTALAGVDDLELEHAWRRYATAETLPAVPALLTDDAAARTADVAPPTPREFLAHAATALHSGSEATDGYPPIERAIDTFLPYLEPGRWNPDQDPGPASDAPDTGPDPWLEP
ncbi:hypothetical protein [Nocardia mexicana]|uniref:Uncharacterized protein n=1 Tax=Nocardia mexicana TaxID=279262 RepID=A0A370GIF6_9NOCA|nr:hypothetical protein [Nocardia mexicana]RDI43572.1 hypothetical protein DFR68_12039 [Nocardia mexicana]